MGQKVSSSPRTRTPVYGSPYPTSPPPDGAGSSSSAGSGQFVSVSNGHGAYFTNNSGHSGGPGTSSTPSSSSRNRTRSMVCTPTHSQSQGRSSQHDPNNVLPVPSQGPGASSDSNSDDEVLDRIIGAVRTGGTSGSSRHANGHTRASRGRSLPLSAPLPSHLFPQSFFSGIKCPVCSKFVPPDDIEIHLVVCLTKPRIVYNEDVLELDSGECVICLDELEQGDTIARLPCLCIYHKTCIDMWFERNRSCPEHPLD